MTSTTGTMRRCRFCVQDDTADPDMWFDSTGLCRYCVDLLPKLDALRIDTAESERRIERIVSGIKSSNSGADYDCILGVSGGVDSSYLAMLAVDWGLRALVVHYDNGWDSELAVDNIHNVVSTLGIDLITRVADWEQFRDVQVSFFQAGVVDVELVTDHAIVATVVREAKRLGIRHLLSGWNIATESGMPPSWSWRKYDVRNLKAIHRRFGTVDLRGFPLYSSARMLTDRLTDRTRIVAPLDHLNYRKGSAVESLETRFGWRQYDGKHHESVFTRFYQAIYLPERFGIDKRKVHLSALIRNGEMTRDEALSTLAEPPITAEARTVELEYASRKLGIEPVAFERLLKAPPVPHTAFPSEDIFYRTAVSLGLTASRKGPLSFTRRRAGLSS